MRIGKFDLRTLTIIICTILIAAFIMIALIYNGSSVQYFSGSRNSDYFVEIQHSSQYRIVYDPNTMVMYTMSRTTHNQGLVTPLYNADGSLLLYRGK